MEKPILARAGENLDFVVAKDGLEARGLGVGREERRADRDVVEHGVRVAGGGESGEHDFEIAGEGEDGGVVGAMVG